MNLTALQNEVLNHGFDSATFSARITQYLNDALNLVCRRVDYYQDEATNDYNTISGTALYALPAGWARVRSLRDTSRQVELIAVGLRDIDRASTAQGAPAYYALDGANLHLYPTPDNAYPLELRYWLLPAQLVSGTDVPSIPADWHRILWYWAVKECYAAEDDSATAQYWEQQFNTTLAEFAADQKFPSTDYPTQARGMWGDDEMLTPAGWTAYSGY